MCEENGWTVGALKVQWRMVQTFKTGTQADVMKSEQQQNGTSV